MYYELTKSQKKKARIVIDKGLENHYERALSDVEAICRKWRDGNFASTRDAYMNLYQCVKRNDKNIGRIYDDKGGARWVEVMSMQLADGAITIEDLNAFDEKLRNILLEWAGMKE
jgi:hypothetical protein